MSHAGRADGPRRNSRPAGAREGLAAGVRPLPQRPERRSQQVGARREASRRTVAQAPEYREGEGVAGNRLTNDQNWRVERSGAERPSWHLDRFWGRWAVAETAVRAQSVVMIAPPAGDAADLLQTVEDLAIEQFITQASIEALDIAVLPRAAGLDVEGGDTEAAQPSAHSMGDELGAIIGPDMLGRPMLDEQLGQHVDDVVGSEPPQRHHCQALPAELVNDVEHPELASVVRLILDEVVGPHMPAMLRAQPDA